MLLWGDSSHFAVSTHTAVSGCSEGALEASHSQNQISHSTLICRAKSTLRIVSNCSNHGHRQYQCQSPDWDAACSCLMRADRYDGALQMLSALIARCRLATQARQH